MDFLLIAMFCACELFSYTTSRFSLFSLYQIDAKSFVSKLGQIMSGSLWYTCCILLSAAVECTSESAVVFIWPETILANPRLHTWLKCQLFKLWLETWPFNWHKSRRWQSLELAAFIFIDRSKNFMTTVANLALSCSSCGCKVTKGIGRVTKICVQ